MSVWGLSIWKYKVNLLYVFGLYVAYVAIFFAFNGAYYAFLAVRKRVLVAMLRRRTASAVKSKTPAGEVLEEAAVAEEKSAAAEKPEQEEQQDEQEPTE